MYSTKITFKDEWFNVGAGILERSEISTETLYASTEIELQKIKDEFINSRVGSTNTEGIQHTTTVEDDESKRILSKEDMFEFMLRNDVNCTLSNSIWTGTDGKKKRVKYHVQINGVDLAGFDLEEAIQYYYDNHRSKVK